MNYLKTTLSLILAITLLASCNKKFDKDIEWDKKSFEKTECFDIVYPLTFNMPDESNIDMENGDDWDAIKAWYESNDSEVKPVLIYPVQVRANEALLTLNNDIEFEAWKKDNC